MGVYMKKLLSTISDSRYNKNIIYDIIEHIDDDDYFYYKKINFEDWVVMRIDIQNILGKKKNNMITDITIKDISYILNGEKYV